MTSGHRTRLPNGKIGYVEPGCDGGCQNVAKGSMQPDIPIPMTRRNLDKAYQQAIWTREAEPELFDNTVQQGSFWAREAAPEIISDSSGQPIWKRDDDRFNIRGLLERRWADAEAADEARSAALAEIDYLERRWADVEEGLYERGFDLDDGTGDPGVWY